MISQSPNVSKQTCVAPNDPERHHKAAGVSKTMEHLSSGINHLDLLVLHSAATLQADLRNFNGVLRLGILQIQGLPQTPLA